MQSHLHKNLAECGILFFVVFFLFCCRIEQTKSGKPNTSILITVAGLLFEETRLGSLTFFGGYFFSFWLPHKDAFVPA